MKLNIGCGPHRARTPWINVDRVYVPGDIEPDVINPSGRPADLLCDTVKRNTVTHVYLGHVLEHVAWDAVPDFLGELHALLVPGGSVCVVGPDVNRAIDWYKNGQCGWNLVDACLEGPDPQIDGLDVGHDGARHQWNCTEERVVQSLTTAGFVDVAAVEPRMLESVWPLVSPIGWQCAVTAVAP